jgi:tight adherence protein C
LTPLVLAGIGVAVGLIMVVNGLVAAAPATAPALMKPRETTAFLNTSLTLTRALWPSRGQTSLSQDLAVAHRSEESVAVTTAVAAIAGATMPMAAVASLGAAGSSPPLLVALASSVGLGLAGAFMPLLVLRRQARARREHFCHALSCWLELVTLAQAGGMGVEGALVAASAVAGDGAFLEIRRALDHARHAGWSPWKGLARLGNELGIPELEELASSIALAGTEGARVRQSLGAQSASMRRREIARSESRANATTERLFLPAIVLMIGFMIFLLYPAVVTLSRVV